MTNEYICHGYNATFVNVALCMGPARKYVQSGEEVVFRIIPTTVIISYMFPQPKFSEGVYNNRVILGHSIGVENSCYVSQPKFNVS